MSFPEKIAVLREFFSLYKVFYLKKPNNYNEPTSGTYLAHIYELGEK